MMQVAALGLLALFATPQTASAQWCWFFCSDSGSSGGGSSSGIVPATLGNGALMQTIEESVPFTGVTHLVILTGKGAFPDRSYVQNGDRLLFVNKASGSIKIEASNAEWNTGTLGNKQGFLLFVQPGVQTEFRKVTSWWDNNGISGDFKVNQTPSQVNYPNSQVGINSMLGLQKVPTAVLTNLLSEINGLQVAKGVTNTVSASTGGLLGSL
ncbi:hypothetical protein ATO6_13640 [Oceanicola sp. 22II-s10i]|nr:hypothetical protein ATO6_13640 [Oceanicola sp. 22II-s10i]